MCPFSQLLMSGILREAYSRIFILSLLLCNYCIMMRTIVQFPSIMHKNCTTKMHKKSENIQPYTCEFLRWPIGEKAVDYIHPYAVIKQCVSNADAFCKTAKTAQLWKPVSQSWENFFDSIKNSCTQLMKSVKTAKNSRPPTYYSRQSWHYSGQSWHYSV